MDGGFHGEEDRPGPVSLSPEQARQQYYYDISRQYTSHPDDDHHSFDRSPVYQQSDIPPQESSYDNGYEGPSSWGSERSYAQANFQAFAANAAAAASNPSTDRYANSKPVDPDDFYRNYRGGLTVNAVQQPFSPSGDASSMASASPTSRRLPPPRATANGTNSTNSRFAPPPALAGRTNGARQTLRSVSSPVDDRQNNANARTTAAAAGYGGVAAQSVKDLKKKFDNPGLTQNGAPAVRKTAPRNPPSREPSVGPVSRTTGGSNGKPQYGALRTGTPSNTGTAETRIPGSRGTQRQKSVPEDHLSTNSQSFASRISKPRSTVTPNALTSKSTSYLLAETSPVDLTTSPPLPLPKPLLFGEILPEQNDSVTAGFGISVVRPRRTSDSNIPSPSLATHQRSLSDPDGLEPSSPTDWYRGESLSQQRSEPTGQHVKITKGHGRAQSDLTTAQAKPTLPRLQKVPVRPRHDQSPGSQPTSPSSRLPRSVKKFNTSNTSATSTRSNSPSTTKRHPVNGRTPRQNGPPPVTRAKTPTSRSQTPTASSKTPTHNSNSTKRTPSHINTVNTAGSSNTRLNAFVSTPQPKLSPSLRSSRPRQSVASATTASSRMRTADRAQSPSKQRSGLPRAPSRQEESGLKRPRKISVGPIDFAQRRETIKLAYSRSIRESRALEARQTAAERRKRELEAVAHTKEEAEAVVAAALTASDEEAASRPTASFVQRKDSRTELPLKIVTDILSVQPSDKETSTNLDSPTLGMPGGFPAIGSPSLNQVEREVTPQSAVSSTSVVTEFDIEPQTEPATQETTTTIDEELSSVLQKQEPESHLPTHPPPLQNRVSYQYPFADDDETADIGAAIPESAGELPADPPSRQPTPTFKDWEPLPNVPGSFDNGALGFRPSMYPSPVYETKVTILSRDQDFIPVRLSTDSRSGADSYLAPVEQYPPTVTSDPRETDGHVIVGPKKERGLTMDSLESFYGAPRLQDNITALRQSTFSSSDRDASLDGTRSISDHHMTPDTSHSLTVPPLLTPANRLSHASNWTDFSFGSAEDPNVPTKGYSLPGQVVDYPGRKSVASQAPSERGLRDSSYEDITHSTEISPRDMKPQLPSIRPDSLAEEPQLPELDTGAGFSVPYLSGEPTHDDKLRSPLPPDHSPPPVPDEYDLDDNAYYNDTRPSSYLRNDEDGEGMPQPTSTPHSIEKMSLDTPETQSMTLVPSQASMNDLPGMSDKETKRLKQRQLVIKELIDTEDTFIRDMSVVEEIYKGTAEACPNLDAQTVKIIFRNSGEIIAFHTAFLAQLKEGVTSVYVAKGKRTPLMAQEPSKSTKDSDAVTVNSQNSSGASSLKAQIDDGQDRKTSVGPVFSKNIEKLKTAHEGFLRTSDTATKRLIQIQEDTAVKVWLSECNEVAKELTTAWNLDSLLIKPMQRITKYPNLIGQLLEHTPYDHPDREALVSAKAALEDAILDINKTKKNFELVGQIVGRKRKESDVKAGIARAFGKRVDKLQTSGTKIAEDADYLKYHEKFGDDYLRLQVVLRDVEFYTRAVSKYVHEFLQYLSSMELVMRLQPSKQHGHLESKWVQFNVSMRDIEKVLEQHLLSVRKDVIEPFESVIRCYGNPSLAMKKRAKRRLDYEKCMQLKNAGKKVDKQLAELVEQYEALNETLKKELPKLSDLTAKIGNICLGKFVIIQTNWYNVWKEKVKAPLQDAARVPEWTEIISAFRSEFKLMEDEAMTIGMLNPALRGRTSQSTTDDSASTYSKTRPRAGDMTPRNRGLSVNSDSIPSLPTPEFAKRNSGNNFAISPSMPSPNHAYYRDYYAGINSHSRGASSPITPIVPPVSTPFATAPAPPRPSTGRSYEPTSAAAPRPSVDSTGVQSSTGGHSRRESNSTYNSPSYPAPEQRRFSGLFHSALPLPDSDEKDRSRASSRERSTNSRYNILWLAASLFEFNIETTKIEAGYPYLTYQAGEIFDVIAEKGELWLAKNQDDPRDQVGWIWSKHFAKLADS